MPTVKRPIVKFVFTQVHVSRELTPIMMYIVSTLFRDMVYVQSYTFYKLLLNE